MANIKSVASKCIVKPIFKPAAGDGHITQAARSKMDNKTYASTLNGLTSNQLKQEKAALERQLKGLKRFGTSAERKELQQKLDLATKELNSRPANWKNNLSENLSREQLQKECAKKTTTSLQSELQQLYRQREQEQQMANTLRGMGASVQSQFDSHYDKDSMTEKRIGAIEAELTKRGASLGQAALSVAALREEMAAQQNFINQRNDAVMQLWCHSRKLGGWDGIMSHNDLSKALHDKNTPQELKNAIQFLFNNPSVLNEIDTAKNGGKTDGKISTGDLQAIMKRWGI